MRNILFFGDSLTAGYGLRDAQRESFPALIGEQIRLSGLSNEVINAGSSGDTSSGGLARLDYWLARKVDVLVLELGINDLFRNVPPERIKHNLQSIMDRVVQRYPDVSIALMGMEIPPGMGGILVRGFRDIYRELADVNHCAFIPFFLEGVAGIPELNLPDQLNPNAAGYRVIAGKVWPVLEPLLTREFVRE